MDNFLVAIKPLGNNSSAIGKLVYFPFKWCHINKKQGLRSGRRGLCPWKICLSSPPEPNNLFVLFLFYVICLFVLYCIKNRPIIIALNIMKIDLSLCLSVLCQGHKVTKEGAGFANAYESQCKCTTSGLLMPRDLHRTKRKHTSFLKRRQAAGSLRPTRWRYAVSQCFSGKCFISLTDAGSNIWEKSARTRSVFCRTFSIKFGLFLIADHIFLTTSQ